MLKCIKCHASYATHSPCCCCMTHLQMHQACGKKLVDVIGYCPPMPKPNTSEQQHTWWPSPAHHRPGTAPTCKAMLKAALHVFTLSACQLHQTRQGWHSDMLLYIVGTVVLQPCNCGSPLSACDFEDVACNSFLKPVHKIKQLAVCMIVSEQGRTHAGCPVGRP